MDSNEPRHQTIDSTPTERADDLLDEIRIALNLGDWDGVAGLSYRLTLIAETQS